MTTALNPPLKWHGGKHYLAKRIIALMPPHSHYVEPYFGGGAVLLAKPCDGIAEVANDIDGELMGFWRVLADEHSFDWFKRIVAAVPFSQEAFDAPATLAPQDNATHAAVRFFIRCRQSLAGRGKSFAPVTKTRTRRGMNEQVAAWLSAVEGLTEVHARMRRVLLLRRPALDVIDMMDGPETLFYLDPPYLLQTRTAPDVFTNEMNTVAHVALLKKLRRIRGKFLLSGYRSPLYDACARAWGWKRHDFELPNNAASGATKRRMTESVWCNYECPDQATVQA